MLAQAYLSHHYHDFDIYCFKKSALENPNLQNKIIEGLIQEMPEYKVQDYFSVKKHIFSEADNVIVAYKKDTECVVGVIASNWLTVNNLEFLQIMTILLGTQYHRSSLFLKLWKLHLQQIIQDKKHLPSIIAYKTYNPISFRLLRHFAKIPHITLYPNISQTEQDKKNQNLVTAIAKKLNPDLEFQFDKGVIKKGGGDVPPDFYKTLPYTTASDVYDYFKNNLTPYDRLLCVLLVDSDEAKKRMLELFR